MVRTRTLAPFLFASFVGGTALLLALGAPRHETAILPLQRFVEGRQDARATGSWIALEKGLAHRAGDAPGRSLYEATFFRRRLEGLGLQYPPTALLLMRAALPVESPRRWFERVTWLWVPVTAVLIALLDRRASALSGATWSRREQWGRCALAAVATLTFHPLMRAYATGQIQAWVTGLFAGALLAWLCGRAALAGGLVALMAAFKPQAAFLVLWAIVRGRWGFVGGFAAVAVPLLAGSIAAHGLDAHLEYLRVLAFLARRGEAYHANQSVNGTLHRALGNGESLLFFAGGSWSWRAHFPPYHAFVFGATLLSGIALVAASLWPPRVARARDWTADFCIAALTMLLASPIAWDHDFGILLPIFAVLAARVSGARAAVWTLAALYFVAANPWWITRAFAGPQYRPLQSWLVFVGAGTLGLLYWLHARDTVALPGVRGARGIRARLDWRPTPAQALAGAQALGLAALVAALTAFAFLYDLAQARAGVYVLWDPELFYMLNSLLPFKGHSYTFIDHPGTPVEVIGTALAAGLWPVAWARSQSLAELCIAEPWMFLVLGHLVLTVAAVAVVIVLVRRVIPLHRWDDVVSSLAVGCLYFILHRHALQSLAYWSHNSFNFQAGALLTLVLLLVLRGGPPGTRRLVGLGIAAGGLAAVQLYMGAWAVGIAVAVAAAALLRGEPRLRAGRAGLVVCSGSAAGFVLFTLPVASDYPRFARWVMALATAQGVYGSGAKGFSLDAYLANAWTVVAGHAEAFTVFALATAAIVLAAARDRGAIRDHAGTYAVALGIAAQGAILALAIFKHPGSLYVLSIAALAPVQLAIAFLCWRQRGPMARALCVAAASAVVFVFVCRYAQAVAYHAFATDKARLSLDHVERLLREKEEPGKRQLRVWTAGTDSTCFALWLANNDRVQAFTREIAARCPRDGGAWYDTLWFAADWRRIDPRSASMVMVSTESVLAAQPTLRRGSPETTGAETLFFGPYVLVPIPPGRVAEVLAGGLR